MKFVNTLLLCFCAIAANAGTIIVENTNNSGTGSLRTAVSNAHSNDTIRFNPNLIASGSDSIVLTSHISFQKSLIFKGLYNSTDTLYISGRNLNRHFNILNAGNVTMDSMVLINGYTYDSGGSIVFQSYVDTLFINQCSIYGNSAWNGGGISASPRAHVNVNNSIITKNEAAGEGGGIYSQASVTVSNSTISENSTSGNGGGISSPSVVIINSTLSKNSGRGGGGGIYSFSNYSFAPPFIEVTNSTINENSAGNNGSGIYAYFNHTSTTSSSSIKITNTTINNNSTNNSGTVYSLSNSPYSSSSIEVTNYKRFICRFFSHRP